MIQRIDIVKDHPYLARFASDRDIHMRACRSVHYWGFPAYARARWTRYPRTDEEFARLHWVMARWLPDWSGQFGTNRTCPDFHPQYHRDHLLGACEFVMGAEDWFLNEVEPGEREIVADGGRVEIRQNQGWREWWHYQRCSAYALLVRCLNPKNDPAEAEPFEPFVHFLHDGLQRFRDAGPQVHMSWTAATHQWMIGVNQAVDAWEQCTGKSTGRPLDCRTGWTHSLVQHWKSPRRRVRFTPVFQSSPLLKS